MHDFDEIDASKYQIDTINTMIDNHDLHDVSDFEVHISSIVSHAMQHAQCQLIYII